MEEEDILVDDVLVDDVLVDEALLVDVTLVLDEVLLVIVEVFGGGVELVDTLRHWEYPRRF